MQMQQGPPMQPHKNMGGFMGNNAPRSMLPSSYKYTQPPTNSYQTDLALAAAANSMTPMPMVHLLASVQHLLQLVDLSAMIAGSKRNTVVSKNSFECCFMGKCKPLEAV